MHENHRNKSGKAPSSIEGFTLNDLLEGKQLELVAAALLLTGKLRVDSLELYRSSPIISVTLIGKFKNNNKNGKSDALADFLSENGDMTMDDVFDAFQKRMGREKDQ